MGLLYVIFINAEIGYLNVRDYFNLLFFPNGIMVEVDNSYLNLRGIIGKIFIMAYVGKFFL